MSLCMKIIFSPVGLFVVLTIYSSLGALIFQAIEGPDELIANSLCLTRAQQIESERAVLIHTLIERGTTFDADWNSTSIYSGELFFENQLQQYWLNFSWAHFNYSYDGTTNPPSYHWSFFNAFLFTTSIVTTIGYGQTTPKHNIGCALVIPYALIGIPCMLVFIASVGEGFKRALRFIYYRLMCGCCRSRRITMFQKETDRTGYEVCDPANPPSQMTKGDEPIPTFVMVIFGILYNIGGAGLMMCFEKWNFIKANYFSFVSLMTIGFGDVVPAGDEQNYNQTRGMLSLIIGSAYITIGLGVVGVCVNVIMVNVIMSIHFQARKLAGSDNDVVVELAEEEDILRKIAHQSMNSHNHHANAPKLTTAH